jgi:hypothetical protein
MRLYVDITKVKFEVSKNPEPKTDDKGVQRTDRKTQLPVWATQLYALDAEGGEVLSVSVAGATKPELTVGQLVTPVNLEALPWMTKRQNGEARNGVSFRASELRPVPSGSSK